MEGLGDVRAHGAPLGKEHKLHRFRHSLLWTFTGAFLIVLIVGIVLQVVLVAGVLGPAARHWRSTTREAIARTVASSIAEALAGGEEEILPVLQAGNEAADENAHAPSPRWSSRRRSS